MTTASKPRIKRVFGPSPLVVELKAQSRALELNRYQVLGRATEFICAQGIMRFRREGPIIAQSMGDSVLDHIRARQQADLLIPSDWPGLPELVDTSDKPCQKCLVTCEFCVKSPGLRTCTLTGCGGKGYIAKTCVECGSSGAFQYRPGRFFQRIRSMLAGGRCSACKGTGQFKGPACGCCKGTGKMVCDGCHGSGKMPSGKAAKNAEGSSEVPVGQTFIAGSDDCAFCRGLKRVLTVTPQPLEPYIYGRMLAHGIKDELLLLGPVERIVLRGASPREVRNISVIDIAPDRDERSMSLVLQGQHRGAKAWLAGGSWSINSVTR